MKDSFETPLRKIRKARGLSLAELARLGGLTEKAIYNLETGRSNGTHRTRRKLAEILGVTPEELGPSVSIGGDVEDASIIAGSQDITLMKNIHAGRDVAMTSKGKEPSTHAGAETLPQPKTVATTGAAGGTGSGISSIAEMIRRELREVLSEEAERRREIGEDLYKDDLAARLVEEELSRLPQLRLTPERKRKLVRIVRMHLKTAISSFVDTLEEEI